MTTREVKIDTTGSSTRAPVRRATASEPGPSSQPSHPHNSPGPLSIDIERFGSPDTADANRAFTLNQTSTGRPTHIRQQPSRSSTTIGGWAQDSGLSHIDIPRTFGETGEYWKYYDELSDRHDKDVVKILSDNLDILLIFAGLFSAVNTAFIILTLTNLSPDPNAQTVKLLSYIAQGQTSLTDLDLQPSPWNPTGEAVRVNCFFSASLASSLLAAFGAVMAKQWVLHYARGQVGTLETQGRARQRKLNGVEKWHFQHAVETLPVLLQFSLVAFFVGLLDYLRSLNHIVAYVTLGFALMGVLVYTITVLVATFDPQCPFQTPVSIFLRQAIEWTRTWFREKRKYIKSRLQRLHSRRTPNITLGHMAAPFLAIALGSGAVSLGQQVRRGGFGFGPLEPVEPKGHHDEVRNDDADIIDNQTACWVIETSEHGGALLATARNIPALKKIAGTKLAMGDVAFHRLLSLFKEALTKWRASNSHRWTPVESSAALEAAVIYGRALAHAVVGSHCGAYSSPLPQGFQWPRWRYSGNTESNELVFLRFCITAEIPRDFCLNHSKDTMPQPSSALPIYIAAILEPYPEIMSFRVKASKLDRVTLVQWLVRSSLSAHDAYSPNVVGLCAWALGMLPLMVCGGSVQFDDELRRLWWNAYASECDLYPNIILALNAYAHYHRLSEGMNSLENTSHADYRHHLSSSSFLDIYVLLLRAARAIIDVGTQHQEALNELTMELDAALRQTLQTVRIQAQESSMMNLLSELENELIFTMKSLRRDGVEMLMPRTDLPEELDGQILVMTPGEEQSLSLLELNSELPSIITKALRHTREGTRYAALSIIHDHLFAWFASDKVEIHRRFRSANLVHTLMLCLDDPENFELLSGIVSKLIEMDDWRTDLVVNFLTPHYHSKAILILTEEPSFRRLEMFLDVWLSCRRYPDCAHFVATCQSPVVMTAIQKCISSINNAGRRQRSAPHPYIPTSLETYMASIGEACSLDAKENFSGLKLVYRTFVKFKEDSWWDLSDR